MDSLKKQAVYNTFGHFVKFAIGFITPLILVRIFSKTEFGLYNQILLVIDTATTVLGLNIAHNLYYFLPIYDEVKHKRSVLTNTLTMVILINILLVIIVVIVKNNVISLIDYPLITENIFLILMIICFNLLYQSVSNIFVIEGKSKYAMYYYIISSIIRTSSILIVVLIYQNVLSLIYVLFMNSLLNTILFISYLVEKYKISFSSFDFSILKNQIKYTYPVSLSGIASNLGNRVDKLILTAFLPPASYAIYRVGNFNIPLLSMAYTSIGNVMLPRMSEYSKTENGNQKAINLWHSYIEKNVILGIPIIIFFWFVAPEFITLLFGNEYLDSANVFRIYIFTMFIHMLGFGYLLRAFGFTKPILRASILKVVLAIVLGFILIKDFGIIGAAVAYLIAYSSNGILQIYFTKSYFKLNLANLLPWKMITNILLISTFLIIFLFPIKYYLDLGKIFFLALTMSIYFPMIYFAFRKVELIPSVLVLYNKFKKGQKIL